jgi:phosphomannomutase
MAEARRAAASSGARFVFGFEEALGYCLGDVVADKDGISAALALCSLAAHLKAQGRSLHDALGDLEARHGAWISGQTLRRFEGGDAQARMAEMMERVRAAPPGQVGDLGLRSVVDHLGAEPPSNLLELRYGEGLRVLVRPSGTEPKVKIYFEWRDPGGRAQGRRRLAELQRAWDEVDPS